MIRISIIGLGLIGASIGMALRSADPKESPLGAIEVLGWDQDQQAIKAARGRLAIDRESKTLAEVVRDAQIIVVATPVQAVKGVFSQLAMLLPAGAVVTDVASTKAEVTRWAASLPSGVAFVGGHPMAGKERSGTAAADPELFKEAIYCLTVGPNTPQTAIEAIEALVRTLGAKPYFIDPEEHDVYVAGISHLPLLLSAGLVEVTSRGPGWKEMAPLAATGFRDVSRLASGDPEMHRDICLTNAPGISRWLTEMATLLLDIRDQITAGDAEAVEEFLRRAKLQRDAWIESKPNLRPGEGDFANQPPIERPNLLTFRLPNRKK